ncbi:MAG: TatD family hydrolase [Alistipes sp.]|jgi:TatD DNase family protein|nr:TatD family hydrolase [Alistipes sp.]
MDAPYIDIHTHRRTGEGIELVSVSAGTTGAAGARPAPPFSIGVHPWQLANSGWPTIEAAALREVETAPAAAIGEIGLDFAQGTPDPEAQKALFETQLKIARERDLPVVLHCVRAFEPTMELLARHRIEKVIFHSFVGSPEQARQAVAKGYHISVGPRSLVSPKTVEALRVTPLERLFLETDDSDTSISEIYARVATLLGLPLPQLKKQLQENYQNIFKK